MSTLAEIEQAAEKLSPEQKQELMLFLGARLRAERAGLPERSTDFQVCRITDFQIHTPTAPFARRFGNRHYVCDCAFAIELLA